MRTKTQALPQLLAKFPTARPSPPLAPKMACQSGHKPLHPNKLTKKLVSLLNFYESPGQTLNYTRIRPGLVSSLAFLGSSLGHLGATTIQAAFRPLPKALKSIYSSPYPLRLFPSVARLYARSQNLIFRAVPGIAREAEDSDLIARVRKGDIEGFNLLVSRWEKRVFNYLLRLTGSPDDSLDLSQDVFLKAYQNIRKLDDTARFGPWLYRIAHNEAYSSFRKRRPEVAAPEFEGAETFFERQPAPGIAIDLSLAVTGALDRLSPEQREAVVLKVYQGFKFDEMAEILECPVSTIKSRLYTALDLLKAELAPTNTRGTR